MALFYIAMIVVNTLSNTLPLNGQTAAEISNRIDVLFTPAGYVFSIWFVIYFLLGGWLLVLFLLHKKTPFKNKRLATRFCLSCALNIAWLFAFHYEYFILSNIIIIGLLLTLILIYLSYPIGDSRFGGRLPFSLYLGWISVATIANISYTLKYYDVSLGINEVSGTIILLVIAACIALTGRYISDDPFFAAVFVWAILDRFELFSLLIELFCFHFLEQFHFVFLLVDYIFQLLVCMLLLVLFVFSGDHII